MFSKGLTPKVGSHAARTSTWRTLVPFSSLSRFVAPSDVPARAWLVHLIPASAEELLAAVRTALQSPPRCVVMFRALSAAPGCRRLTAPSALMLTAGLDAARRFARMPRSKHPSWNAFGSPTWMDPDCQANAMQGSATLLGRRHAGRRRRQIEPRSTRRYSLLLAALVVAYGRRTRRGSEESAFVVREREVDAVRGVLDETVQGAG